MFHFMLKVCEDCAHLHLVQSCLLACSAAGHTPVDRAEGVVFTWLWSAVWQAAPACCTASNAGLSR